MKKGHKEKDIIRLSKDYKRNQVGSKEDRNKTATTRHLTRVIIYLSNVDYAYQTKIQRELGLETTYLKDAINFLLNHKIIFDFVTQIGKTSKLRYYSLNPLFKK